MTNLTCLDTMIAQTHKRLQSAIEGHTREFLTKIRQELGCNSIAQLPIATAMTILSGIYAARCNGGIKHVFTWIYETAYHFVGNTAERERFNFYPCEAVRLTPAQFKCLAETEANLDRADEVTEALLSTAQYIHLPKPLGSDRRAIIPRAVICAPNAQRDAVIATVLFCQKDSVAISYGVAWEFTNCLVIEKILAAHLPNGYAATEIAEYFSSLINATVLAKLDSVDVPTITVAPTAESHAAGELAGLTARSSTDMQTATHDDNASCEPFLEAQVVDAGNPNSSEVNDAPAASADVPATTMVETAVDEAASCKIADFPTPSDGDDVPAASHNESPSRIALLEAQVAAVQAQLEASQAQAAAHQANYEALFDLFAGLEARLFAKQPHGTAQKQTSIFRFRFARRLLATRYNPVKKRGHRRWKLRFRHYVEAGFAHRWCGPGRSRLELRPRVGHYNGPKNAPLRIDLELLAA